MSTLSTAARNAACNATVDLLDAGGGPGKLKIYTAAAALLMTFALDNTAYGDSAVGVATLAGTPKYTLATASGEADNYTVTDKNDVVVLSGPVSELAMADTTVVNGAPFALLSGTHTQPASS